MTSHLPELDDELRRVDRALAVAADPAVPHKERLAQAAFAQALAVRTQAEAAVLTAASLSDLVVQQSEAAAQVAAGLDLAVLQLAQLLERLREVIPQCGDVVHAPDTGEVGRCQG